MCRGSYIFVQLHKNARTSKKKLLEVFSVSEAEIEAINERVRLEVEECVKFSEESPYPEADELLKDVYVDQNYPFIVD